MDGQFWQMEGELKQTSWLDCITVVYSLEIHGRRREINESANSRDAESVDSRALHSYLSNIARFRMTDGAFVRGSGTLLTLPNFNLEWRHKSFSFLAAKLWNSLPTYVRNAKDISTFKCLLKKQILDRFKI